VVYEWSHDVWKHAPDRGFGAEGLEAPFEMLVEHVMPLVRESIEHRKRAILIASNNSSVFDPAESVAGLEWEVRQPADELLELCQTQWDATRSTATQLSKTLEIMGEPGAVHSIREILESQLTYSDQFWEEGEEALRKLYASYLECGPERSTQLEWETTLLEFSARFADLARTVHEKMENSAADLDSYDPDMRTLKSRLRSLAHRAQKTERRVLEAAQETATEFQIRNSAYAAVYGRLSELDPVHYPSGGIIDSARR
jgi:hypothetical protein